MWLSLLLYNLQRKPLNLKIFYNPVERLSHEGFCYHAWFLFVIWVFDEASKKFVRIQFARRCRVCWNAIIRGILLSLRIKKINTSKYYETIYCDNLPYFKRMLYNEINNFVYSLCKGSWFLWNKILRNYWYCFLFYSVYSWFHCLDKQLIFQTVYMITIL